MCVCVRVFNATCLASRVSLVKSSSLPEETTSQLVRYTLRPWLTSWYWIYSYVSPCGLRRSTTRRRLTETTWQRCSANHSRREISNGWLSVPVCRRPCPGDCVGWFRHCSLLEVICLRVCVKLTPEIVRLYHVGVDYASWPGCWQVTSVNVAVLLRTLRSKLMYGDLLASEPHNCNFACAHNYLLFCLHFGNTSRITSL